MALPQTFPELACPRLLLRACTAADAPGLLETFSHPEVMRYWSTPPWTGPGDAERFLGRAEALWQALERLHFRREGLLRERWDVGGEICDTLLLGLLRREWVAARLAEG